MSWKILIKEENGQEHYMLNGKGIDISYEEERDADIFRGSLAGIYESEFKAILEVKKEE